MKLFILVLFLSLNVFGQITTSAPSLFHASGKFTGGNIDLGSSAQASFIEMTNASLTFTPDSGSAAIATVCATTNAATAPTTSTSTCAAGNESIGVNFTILRTGLHEVCVNFAVTAQSAAGTALNVSDNFQLVETPTNAQTQTTNTAGLAWASKIPPVASNDSIGVGPSTICRNFNFSTVGTKAVRLFYQMAAATIAASSHLVLADNSNARSVYWTVNELGQ